ncbi:MAG: hypothetical protein AAF604_10795 [Acidobacteriota bacterium]
MKPTAQLEGAGDEIAAERSAARSWAVPYLILQGLGIAAWWILMWSLPEWRQPFRDPAAPWSALGAFGPADLMCVAACLFGAWGVARRRPWRRPVLWLLAGAMVYAASYCLALTALTGHAVAAPLLMVPAALITLWLARGE